MISNNQLQLNLLYLKQALGIKYVDMPTKKPKENRENDSLAQALTSSTCTLCHRYLRGRFAPRLIEGAPMFVTTIAIADAGELSASNHAKKFQSYLKACGFQNSYSLSSLVKCALEKPDTSEIEACKMFLDYEIEIAKPSSLFLFGAEFAQHLFNVDFAKAKLDLLKYKNIPTTISRSLFDIVRNPSIEEEVLTQMKIFLKMQNA